MTDRRESTANVDARRALGVRPGGQPPPRLHIEHSSFYDIPPSPTLQPPSSPRSPLTSRNVTFPLAPPSPRSRNVSFPNPLPPSSPTADQPKRFRRPTLTAKSRTPLSSATSNRGLYETQKLLSHLLEKLENRESAPDLLDRAAINAREVSGRAKGKGKGKVQRLGHAIAAVATTAAHSSGSAGPSRPSAVGVGIGSEDFDDAIVLAEGEWDTEAIYDLVEKTRGLLVLAEKQNLNLFDDDGGHDIPNLDSTPVKNKRRAGRFSSVTSPITSSKPNFPPSPAHSRPSTSIGLSGPSLLGRMLSILQSLINIDCLHRTHLFRPLCPPNALQAACLDIAGYLYKRCDTRTKIRVVGMIVDGLYGMGQGMTERICEWLEGRLGELLRNLAKARGGLGKAAQVGFNDPFFNPEPTGTVVPTFAISTDTPDDTLLPPVSTPGWQRYSPTSPSFSFFPRIEEIAGVLSTHTERDTTSTTYQIAALIPRILMAVSSTVDLTASKLTTIHRVHRLLSLVLTAKPDSSLDLLEIVAYAPPVPRRAAAEILATFYPGVTGHNAIARRLANTTYSAQRSKWETGQEKALREENIEDHHFLPWRVSSKDGPNTMASKCSVCNNDLHGFALRCSLCKEHRHLHCYQSSVGVFPYDVVTLSQQDSSSQMVHIKFSQCLSRLDEQVIHGSTSRGNSSSTRRKVGQHDLDLVNLFNMTLCDACHDPLWGTAGQGYGCTNGCQRFFHASCLDRMEDSGRAECRYGRDVVIDEISSQGSNPFTITLEKLQQSFERTCAHLCVPLDDKKQRSYDEVAVLYGALWTQYQIFKNGVSSGSIRVLNTAANGRKRETDPLRLKEAVKSYEEYLNSHMHQASSAASDYAHVMGLDAPLGQGYIFSDKYLAYCTALLRAPSSSHHPHGHAATTEEKRPSEGLLAPSGLPLPPADLDDFEEPPCNDKAYEIISLATMSHTLAYDLHIEDDRIAALFLDQLRLTGFISVVSKRAIDEKVIRDGNSSCSFTLPLLMDSSPTVELLILGIEVLLEDLDLTMNEQGLRLLSGRAWPSLLCSPYALERLGKSAVAWVMAEDDCLHRIVKNYASKHKRLPGVRQTAGAAKGTSSVSVYKDDRQRLLAVYVEPWLRALHDQDPALYAHIVYERCKLAAGDVVVQELGDASDEQVASKMAGVALERMATMLDANVVFSVLMDLLTAWLEDLGTLADQDVVYRSLPRLLRNHPTTSPSSELDVFALSRSTSQDGPEGLSRVCRWMKVLSFSGVEIPWPLLFDLIELQATMRTSVEARLDLVIAVNANGQVIDAAGFADVSAKLAGGVFRDMALSGEEIMGQLELDLVRQSMLLILWAYGVSLDDVALSSLNTSDVQAKQPASLSKRRRMTSTRNQVPLDIGMVLAAARLLDKTTFPVEMVLDFLWLLFAKATIVDNVDGFIHHTCPQIYEMIWPLVDLSVDRRSRARVLLRLLHVNSLPLEQIVRRQLDAGTNERAKVRERLLTFILELADESITFDHTNWRASAVGLILLFFDALLDNTEVIPDNLIVLRSLLPTHLQAMSLCFEEFLVQSSDERRLVLLARLRKLQLAMPTWPIISWRVLEELLVEEAAAVTQLRPGRSSQTISALFDAEMVRAILLSLGLEMLSNSVPIKWNTAQRFQQHVASFCAFPWSDPIERITSIILPSLRSALDSSARVIITGHHTLESKTKKTALVGSLFVPVIIDFGNELGKYDYLTQRLILDILMVTFFKQNVRPVELAALSALQTLAEFVHTCECAENRLLALQVLQTAIVRVERESVIRAVPSVFGEIAAVLVKETVTEYPDPAVVEQSRNFLRTIVDGFGRSGLFLQLFRNDAAATGTNVSERSTLGKALQLLQAAEKPVDGIQATLFDSVFRDLSDVLKRGRQTVDQVLASLCHFTASLEVELSEDAAQNFGSFIIRLGKHVAEWNASEFDPNPALKSCASVLDRVVAEASVTLLHQTSTLLHLCLTRFNVERVTVSHLLQVSDRIAKSQSTEDTVRTVLFEIAGSAMNGLNVSPVSMFSLLTFLAEDAFPADKRPARVLAESAPGCVQIMTRTHPTFAWGPIDADMTIGILLQAGTVLCKAEMSAPGVVSQSLQNLTSEAASTQVNVFMFLLLASLDIQMGAARKRIVSLYPILARAISLCLRACSDYLTLQDPNGEGAELSSLVFAVFRLAVLAVQAEINTGTEGGQSAAAMDTLWKRIWPDWFRIITLSVDPTCVNGPLRAVAHSVFLDTILFLSSSQSTILTSHAGTLSHAMAIIVRYQESLATGQQSGKVQRAVHVLDRVGLSSGISVGRKGLVKGIRADLGATERLKVLRMRG
ncbi:hypothetical protein CI109_103183 [Kwoniella shandongensis]|uniref:Uncharacterized protein n=1 Tax=Kwoniella shandongensis TaxID=1734106 RepID=A0A5M6CCH4_9TREE|nr:uncharacterized protein CI109_000374 [Kwoniella shandongensis]KAA5531532.1 hypothetical protein CI109_000374 [Kwoniella shandongensis]